MKEKETRKIAILLSGLFEKIYITEPDTDKKLNAQDFASLFNKQNIKIEIIKDSKSAYEKALNEINNNNFECLIILGSHYLLGDIANKFDINI